MDINVFLKLIFRFEKCVIIPFVLHLDIRNNKMVNKVTIAGDIKLVNKFCFEVNPFIKHLPSLWSDSEVLMMDKLNICVTCTNSKVYDP